MRGLSTRIEQSYHPRPVLNTELNIDHDLRAAFELGQKLSNRIEITLI